MVVKHYLVCFCRNAVDINLFKGLNIAFKGLITILVSQLKYYSYNFCA